MAWPTPPVLRAGRRRAGSRLPILTDGLSARLNKVLVYDRQLASTSVRSRASSRDLGLVRRHRDGAARRLRSQQIEQIVTEEIARLAKTGPTAAELTPRQDEAGVQLRDRPRADRRLRRARPTCSTSTTPSSAIPDKFDGDIARYRDATAASVQQAVRRVARTRATACSSASAPEKSGRATDVGARPRRRSRRSARDRPFSAPEVEDARSSTTAWSSSSSSAATCRRSPSTLATRAGARRRIRPGKAGLAHLTVATIDMGTKTRQRPRDRGRARRPRHDALGSGAAARALAGRVRGAEAQPALRRSRILADVVRNPTFPASRSSTARRSGTSTRSRSRRRTRTRSAAARARRCSPSARTIPTAGPAQGLPSTVEASRAKTSPRFHDSALEAGQLGARLRRRHHAGRGDRARAQALRQLVGRRGAPPWRSRRRPGRGAGRSISSTGRTRRRRSSRSSCRRRRARRRTTTRCARRRGVGRRRLRHAAESEPARGQGLLLRRLLERSRFLRRRGDSGTPAGACRPTRPRSRSSSSTRS